DLPTVLLHQPVGPPDDRREVALQSPPRRAPSPASPRGVRPQRVAEPPRRQRTVLGPVVADEAFHEDIRAALLLVAAVAVAAVQDDGPAGARPRYARHELAGLEEPAGGPPGLLDDGRGRPARVGVG
ncbi:hypothetical protein THAOC_15395, partial [Thalassiosira oceanica]